MGSIIKMDPAHIPHLQFFMKVVEKKTTNFLRGGGRRMNRDPEVGNPVASPFAQNLDLTYLKPWKRSFLHT